MSHIHIEKDEPGDCQVWIYTEEGAPIFTHAICIGGGDTALQALHNAETDLRHSLDQVRRLKARLRRG